MRFSDVEISQLTKAWIAISLAFAIVWRDFGQSYGLNFAVIYLLAALTVGVAFILHELAHKYMAQKFGCWAEFRSFDLGLLAAVLMSFAGFIFAAPGAVMISGLVSSEENGKIAAAGPITNMILAGIFFVMLNFMTEIWFIPLWLSFFFSFGFAVNSWLAFFNLLPIGPLDGSKVMRWSQIGWLLMILVAGFMTFGLSL